LYHDAESSLPVVCVYKLRKNRWSDSSPVSRFVLKLIFAI